MSLKLYNSLTRKKEIFKPIRILLDKKFAIPAKIKKLVQKREQARKNKNWAEADKLRAQIEKLGFNIQDSINGHRISLFQ